MITFQITTEIGDDRCVVLTLPREVPTGPADLVVTVGSPPPEEKTMRNGMADWVEVQTARDSADGNRYPLRGSVARFERPTEPVAETDWEAAR